jgi:hypothetical protein
MPDHDLSPAAQAFLLDLSAWLPKDELERARVGLAGLLAGVRAEEREACAAHIDATAARIRGDRKRVPQVDVWLMAVLEQEAEKIRRGR